MEFSVLPNISSNYIDDQVIQRDIVGLQFGERVLECSNPYKTQV